MGVFGDMLSGVGYALDTPGALTRGLLAGKLGERVSARDLLSGYGLADPQDDSLLANVRDIGTNILTDPLTYAGGALVRGLGGAAKGAASSIPALRNARNSFAMAKGVSPLGSAARIVGGNPESRALAEAAAAQLPSFGDGLTAGAFGSAGPGVSAGAALASAPASTARHEIIHGLVNSVAQGGPGEGLPGVVRAAGWLKGGGQPTGLRAGLGSLLDETAAQSLEHRGTLNQLGGAGRFLFGGAPEERALYAQLLGEKSPLVGKVFGALPNLAKTAGISAPLGVGMYAGSQMPDMAADMGNSDNVMLRALMGR